MLNIAVLDSLLQCVVVRSDLVLPPVSACTADAAWLTWLRDIALYCAHFSDMIKVITLFQNYCK